MKKNETLLYSMGKIDDNLVNNAAPGKKKAKNIQKNWIKWGSGAVAACLCLVLGISAWNSGFFRTPQEPSNTVPGTKQQPNTEQQPSNTQLPQDNSPYVDVSDLLKTQDDAISTDTITFRMLPLNGRIAEYHQVDVSDSGAKLLSDSLGKALDGVENWYRLSGHNELQYLILKDSDNYTLWQFSVYQVWDEEVMAQVKDSLAEGTSIWSEYSWFSLDMDFTPYSYATILKDVYGLNAADDISSITVSPANMDNTDAGLALQAEIGTSAITSAEDIATLYNAISSMVCLGSNNWDKIRMGNDTNLLEEVRQGRYLTITLNNGVQIEGLKYTAISGQFYEYGGVAYEALDKDVAADIDAILGITM